MLRIPRSKVLHDAQLAPDMGVLQHERNFDQLEAWRQHWTTLKDDGAKTNFLLMLKSRRDVFDDLTAAVAVKELALRWIDERYVA